MKWKKSLAMAALAVSGAALSGCRQDMHNQPKFIPLRSSEFFANGSSARLPVTGTVARGHLNANTYLYTGKINGADGTLMPFPATIEVLERGQEQYNIYCTPCHSRTGDGNGMIVQRGYRRAANLHDAKLVNSPIGHFYDVMTNGWGAMPDYSSQIQPQDRWAIAAYIRALQYTENANIADVPADQRNQVKTLAQLREELAGGEAGQQEASQSTTQRSTMGGVGTSQNTSVGPMIQTNGGTSSNDVNRDVNEQAGGQAIQSSRRNPAGQQGHPQGADTAGTAPPLGWKGAEQGQTSLPTGSWQSGPDQRTPQEGQAQPQGNNTKPK